MDCTQRAQDLAQMRVFVNKIMNMRVREHFLRQLSISQELVRLNMPINFMMQGLRSGADRYSDCEKNTSLLCNSKVQYSVYQTSPLNNTVSHLNPAHIPT